MDVHAFFPARYADQSEGLTNVIGGGLTHVKIHSLPFAFRSLAVVAKVLLEQDDVRDSHILKVRIVEPGGDSIYETEDFSIPAGELPPDMEYLNINLGLALTGLVFPSEGRYWFELLFDRIVIKRTPLRLKLNAPGARQEEQGA